MPILLKISNHLPLTLPASNDCPQQTIRNRELAEVASPAVPYFGIGSPCYCLSTAGSGLYSLSYSKNGEKTPRARSLYLPNPSSVGSFISTPTVCTGLGAS
ncbi:uncharacterized protein EDB91DRAFT_1160362 [Suillus paluster]|uniref:uncharacterized protein n=1 Tax=Suillus paluster TaxID=48578 RepID=UPI001B85D6D4|nr:uncharacterized protein EDB91DRAFT_1160362 [Suillus paluster]KAG1728968.1 hypothetical protein EDB91DRAFT_1160362 [Suillus paluster]